MKKKDSIFLGILQRTYYQSILGHLQCPHGYTMKGGESEHVMKTLNFTYCANEIEVRKDNTIVLKPKKTYEWYSDEIKMEHGTLKKYFTLYCSFHKTAAGKIFVLVDSDTDHRCSPELDPKHIKTIEDVRSLIAEALFRVKAFDVGKIPASLKKSELAKGYEYLTVSIRDAWVVAELFSDEYLLQILSWVNNN